MAKKKREWIVWACYDKSAMWFPELAGTKEQAERVARFTDKGRVIKVKVTEVV